MKARETCSCAPDISFKNFRLMGRDRWYRSMKDDFFSYTLLTAGRVDRCYGFCHYLFTCTCDIPNAISEAPEA
jgi:hypothetical protein